jgi:Cu2+-exporting ATPase
LHIHIISGDAEPPTHAIAASLDTTAYQAQVSPEDKLNLLATLHGAGRSPLMVGDGINDVPSLAAASVSIAPLDATDLAKQRSDAFLGRAPSFARI